MRAHGSGPILMPTRSRLLRPRSRGVSEVNAPVRPPDSARSRVARARPARGSESITLAIGPPDGATVAWRLLPATLATTDTAQEERWTLRGSRGNSSGRRSMDLVPSATPPRERATRSCSRSAAPGAGRAGSSALAKRYHPPGAGPPPHHLRAPTSIRPQRHRPTEKGILTTSSDIMLLIGLEQLNTD